MSYYGGTPKCPRCDKAVYAAEQVMGPGRKLYHKPCLSCMICRKRLDSYSLVEHDEQPYCKNCHTKHLGTRDLRAANLPHRAEALISPTNTGTSSHHGDYSPPASPSTAAQFSPTPSFWAGTAVKRHSTGAAPTLPPRSGTGTGWTPLRPTRALSPTGVRSPTTTAFHASAPPSEATEPVVAGSLAPDTNDVHLGGDSEAEEDEVQNMLDSAPPSSPPQPPVALSTPARPPVSFNTPRVTPMYSSTVGRVAGSANGTPVVPTPTGTRYGRALGGSPALSTHSTGSPRWTPTSKAPSCPRCSKTVYHAEQVKAVGQTWHKGCLRCTECSTTLAPGRLSEREGEPYCQRCYSKVHGPQGNGYALLGKAGG